MFRGERAVDTGGVTREMFSSFFENVYLQMFDGCALLYLAMHAGVDLTAFRVVGTTLSHAYIIAGILPVRVAFPCLAIALLGPATVISNTLVYSSFLSSLSAHDASIVESEFDRRESEEETLKFRRLGHLDELNLFLFIYFFTENDINRAFRSTHSLFNMFGINGVRIHSNSPRLFSWDRG